MSQKTLVKESNGKAVSIEIQTKESLDLTLSHLSCLVALLNCMRGEQSNMEITIGDWQLLVQKLPDSKNQHGDILSSGKEEMKTKTMLQP